MPTRSRLSRTGVRNSELRSVRGGPDAAHRLYPLPHHNLSPNGRVRVEQAPYFVENVA